MMRLRRLLLLDGIVITVALIGLYWFLASFFLAKRSLSFVSDCDEAPSLLRLVGLSDAEIQRALLLDKNNNGTSTTLKNVRQGCWMDRRVDSLVILVVDALRFDFCLYNLPRSVGARMHKLTRGDDLAGDAANQQQQTNNHTRLFRFVADPPTVTMQRLKALTTGGLPTFADITANFGGASVEEDNWVHQMAVRDGLNFQKRGLQSRSHIGFVGDDTWEDLYPDVFRPSLPYPSFNTRDLDTVDNGCFKHIPDLMRRNLQTKSQDEHLEVVVVHFLGVDHVGHTYGPHNHYMDAKLKQMDDALSNVLDGLDRADKDSCHVAFIFGDHGMTEGGNHGGGSVEEISAALFVHTSPGCGAMPSSQDAGASMLLERFESSTWSSMASAAAPYPSIHQIDLVPTLCFLLGLPIPYANLGTLVPSLIPKLTSMRERATALALNAAQVWRYLSVYSETANPLPNLHELQKHLVTAVSVFQEGLSEDENNDDNNNEHLEQAAALFQHFLAEALALGQRVWTRFDSVGMVFGIVVLAVAGIVYALPLFTGGVPQHSKRRGGGRFGLLLGQQSWEIGLALLSVLFQCGLLTFSNSYILEEENSIMYFLAVVSIAVALRLEGQWQQQQATRWLWIGVLLLPTASRVSELFVSGHGLDSSLGVHLAHHAFLFLSSLLTLGCFRWSLCYHFGITTSQTHAVVDCITLACLARSWWDKGILDPDPDRNGYFPCQVALIFLFVGIPLCVFEALILHDVRPKKDDDDKATEVCLRRRRRRESDMITLLSKVLIAIMTVTGPSTATTLVLYSVQITVLYILSRAATGPQQVHSIVLAALLRLVTRHVFFATNHGCAFNRLQYTAAFVATKVFYYTTAGISLFLNTFGWEIAALGFAWLLSQPGTPSGARANNNNDNSNLWRIYICYQLLEALTSCISVSLLRRHLMVWDIYAPHFLFVAIFTTLSGFCQLTLTLVSIVLVRD